VKTMSTQASSLKEARDGMQTEFEKKEQALKEREEALQKQLADAQAESAEKQKETTLVKKQMNKIQTEFNVLNGDKVHLLGSLNSVLRQNNDMQQQIKLFNTEGCSVAKNSSGLPIPGNLGSGNMIMADQTLTDAAKADDTDSKQDEASALSPSALMQSAPLARGAASLLQQSPPARTIKPEYRTFTVSGQHKALSSWLSKPVEVLLQRQQVQTPARGRSFLPRDEDKNDDGDVLQQLALISTGWQTHREKA